MKMELAPDVPVYGIVVEKDVDVPMRDGARLKADVLRPDDAGTFPAILNLGPYQKDKLWVPPGNLEEKPNPLMNCLIRAGLTDPLPDSLSSENIQRSPRHIELSYCKDWTAELHLWTAHVVDGLGHGMEHGDL